jgi:hypothetical protein
VGLTTPPIRWIPSVLSLGGKVAEASLDHSLPCIAEVKNEWSYTYTPPVCLIGADRGKFIFFVRMQGEIEWMCTTYRRKKINEGSSSEYTKET